MNKEYTRYYPTFWAAVHLVVLYTFIQTLIDFPLALYDYYHGTDWLYEPWVKVPVFFGSTVFILYWGYRRTGLSAGNVFPLGLYNIFVVPGLLLMLVALQLSLGKINVAFEKLLPPPGWFIEMFSRLFDSDLGVWGGILRVVIIAPVVEELIFRGLIMRGFIRNYPKFLAIFYSALLFALFHLNPWQFPATFLLGLILGWIRIRTGSVLAAITGHAMHNGLVFLTVYYLSKLHRVGILLPDYKLNIPAVVLLFISGVIITFLATFTWKKKSAA